jgi:hypothetical protein
MSNTEELLAKRLRKAITNNNFEEVEKAFRDGAKVNNVDLTGANRNFLKDSFTSMNEDDVSNNDNSLEEAGEEIDELLYDYGAAIEDSAINNNNNDYQNDSLYQAIDNRASPKIFELLFENRARVSNNSIDGNGHRDYYRNSLLHAVSSGANVEVIALLFKHGEKVVNEEINNDGSRNLNRSILFVATMRGASSEVIDLLLLNGAEPEKQLPESYPERNEMITRKEELLRRNLSTETASSSVISTSASSIFTNSNNRSL